MNEPGPDGADHAPGFFLGAAVSPFKRLESEVVLQYLKLALKARAGADFAIPQLGYDSRKWDELLRWMRLHDLRLPVLANVYVLTRTVARLFHANAIPGCVVSDDLLAIIEKAAAGPDKGKGFFLELAAKQVAIARGMGFRGAYIAGHTLPAADVDRILAMAETFAPSLARPGPGGPALAEGDVLRLPARIPPRASTPTSCDPRYARSLAPAARARARRRGSLVYKANRLTHDLAFTPGTPGYRAAARVYAAVERYHLARPAPRPGARRQGPALRLPRLRGLLAARRRLPLPGIAVPQGRAQRALRRQPRRDLRGRPAAVRLGPRPTTGSSPTARSWPCSTGRPSWSTTPCERTSAWANTYLGRDHYGREAAASALRPPQQPRQPQPPRPPPTRRRAAHRGDARMTDTVRGPFIVIGENIHATRVLLRSGARWSLAAGRPAGAPVHGRRGRGAAPAGARHALEGAGQKQKVKHVKAAVLAGLAGGAEAALGRGYVRFLARAPGRRPAPTTWTSTWTRSATTWTGRVAAIRWLVGAVEDATRAALSLDSSAPEVIAAGLGGGRPGGGRRRSSTPRRSSGSTCWTWRRRRAARWSSVPAASTAMPASAQERVRTPGASSRRRHAGGWRFGGAPRGPAGDAGRRRPGGRRRVPRGRAHAAGDVRARRSTSPAACPTSSFGLPLRRLLNDVFIDLAAEAGADSGIIDPVASDPRRIFVQDRSSRAQALAANLLTGRDPFGMEFLTAYRSGELA